VDLEEIVSDDWMELDRAGSGWCPVTDFDIDTKTSDCITAVTYLLGYLSS
jgi:hypothetical protein